MVGARSGHRNAAEVGQRGGVRERGPAPWEGEGEWINDDARPAQLAKFERAEGAADGGN